MRSDARFVASSAGGRLVRFGLQRGACQLGLGLARCRPDRRVVEAWLARSVSARRRWQSTTLRIPSWRREHGSRVGSTTFARQRTPLPSLPCGWELLIALAFLVAACSSRPAAARLCAHQPRRRRRHRRHCRTVRRSPRQIGTGVFFHPECFGEQASAETSACCEEHARAARAQAANSVDRTEGSCGRLVAPTA